MNPLHLSGWGVKITVQDLKSILSRSLEGNIKAVVIRQEYVVLTLNEEGYLHYKKLPYELQVQPEDTLDALIQNEAAT